MHTPSLLTRTKLALITIIGAHALLPNAIADSHADGIKVTAIEPVQGEQFVPLCPATTASNIVQTFNLYRDRFHRFSVHADLAPNVDAIYDVTSLNPGILTVDGKVSTTVTMYANNFDSTEFVAEATQIAPLAVQFQRRPDEQSNFNPYPAWAVPVNVWEFDQIVDYNALDKGSVCYDANNSPALVSGAAKTTCGKEPKAVATDGTSRLLLRLKTAKAGQACFKVVSDGTKDVGKMDPSNSSAIATALDVANPFWAFGTYVAPNAFGDQLQKEREVTIEIAFTPTGTTSNTLAIRRKIKVTRPPMVLVHGLWSNQYTWSPIYQTVLANAVRKVETVDYENLNDRPIDGIIPTLETQMRKFISDTREQNIALTQMDVVAHSMGGILTRRWIASPGFKAPENFNEGAVHRFISLASPLKGTQIGNLMVNMHANFPNNLFFDRFAAIKGDVRKGALCSLADNSPALSYPAEDAVEGFTYTASGGGIGFPWYFDIGFGRYFTPQQITDHISPYGFTVGNDGLVDVYSQQGGLRNENYPNFVHSDPRSDLSVASQLFNELDASPGRFTALPAYTSTGLGTPKIPGVGRDATIEQANFAAQCAPGGPMNP